ncbi:hypothetical protein [Gemmobacter sp.]|uniref:hypothetical protein n=1 Tax=Gemmobacter sp. TaxID=1898957 RepID=UPI002AFF8A94|nr:hypothetical protein [Gemmobacter sp.]
MSTVPIDPAVALAEAQALADYYRNRNLLLAQAVAELRARLQQQAAANPAPVDPEEVIQ